MSVSTRNMLFRGAALSGLAMLGGLAWAGGGGSMPGPAPKPGHSPDPCCTAKPPGHTVNVPGVKIGGPNIVVGGTSVAVNQGSIAFKTQNQLTTLRQGGGATGFIVGGGAGFTSTPGVSPTPIEALDVSGAGQRYTETIREEVPVKEEVCVDKVRTVMSVRPVRAVCLDDTGTPHPSSQVSQAEAVPRGYSGEIYRCMAGTAMQVTIGQTGSGAGGFAAGETFSCDKGEALVHSPGGKLECKPQQPRRDCNERSLLRRFGPGVKQVRMPVEQRECVPKTRTRMEIREREVERVREAKPAPIVFDGGVGQGLN